MHRKILIAALLSALLLPLGSAQARSTGSPERAAHMHSLRAIAFTPTDCTAAIKALTQYERLAKKFGVKISRKRIKELNRKRDNGTISTDDLPATLRRKFPGYFKGRSLRDIARQCFITYGIGEKWAGLA